jgi:hypothetical protein
MTAMYISLVIFAIGLWWAIKYNQDKQRTVNPPKPKYPTIEDIRRKYPKRLSQEELGRQTAAKSEAEAKRDISVKSFKTLLKMVNGQDAVARRLIEGNLRLFPDKSPDWACDKAISDLERDRRT